LASTKRRRIPRICACSALLAGAASLVACRQSANPPSSGSVSASAATPSAPLVASAAPADSSHLPENPELGKRSEEQWRKHMDDEERERQLGFDRSHMKEHGTVVARLKAARASYDRATTAAALTKARDDMPHRVEEIQKQLAELDHWGNNSHLHGDYAALEASLTSDYPDAKLAALKGNAAALKKAQATFDAHLKAISEWLEEAAHTEED
jgi:hypothetical protein